MFDRHAKVINLRIKSEGKGSMLPCRTGRRLGSQASPPVSTTRTMPPDGTYGGQHKAAKRGTCRRLCCFCGFGATLARDFDICRRDGLTVFGLGRTMLKIRLATRGVALTGRSLSPSDKAKLAGRLKLPGRFLSGRYERDRAAKALRGPLHVPPQSAAWQEGYAP